ncbi:MAG: tetratricopeptide repeat protein [Micrococcales bacterium]|nr:tetratricopeptide repeat protein [Micrococcales bacterium]
MTFNRHRTISDDERIRAQELLRAFELDVRQMFSELDVDASELFGVDVIKAISERFGIDTAQPQIDLLVEFLTIGELLNAVVTKKSYFELDQSGSSLLCNSERLSTIVSIRNTLAHHRIESIEAKELALLWETMHVMLLDGFAGKRTLEQMLSRSRVWQDSNDATPRGLALNNLPPPDYSETGFVGRSEILKKITASLGKDPGAAGTFIWLVGPGGVGKSAVALEIATRMLQADRFELIFWASFKPGEFSGTGLKPLVGSLKSIGDLPGVVSQAIAGTQSATSLAEIWSSLAGIPCLIVLDNCETLQGDQFVSLAESEPPTNIRFLLTSRTHGAIGSMLRIPEFSSEESRKLFGKLARVYASDVLRDLVRDQLKFEELLSNVGNTPLALKWVARRCARGDQLETVIKTQGSVFEYCIGAEYRELSILAKEIVGILHESRDWMTNSQLHSLLESSIEDLQGAMRELNDRMFLEQRVAEGLTTRVRLNETVENFLRHAAQVDLRKSVDFRRKLRQLRERGTQNELARQTKGYYSPYFVDRTDDVHSTVAARLYEAIGASKKQSPVELQKQFRTVQGLRETAPDFWEVHRVSGHLLSWLGNKSDAHEEFERAIELAPEGRAKARCLSFLVELVGETDNQAALEFAKQVVDLSPEWDTHVLLGRYLYYAGKIEESISLLEGLYSSSIDELQRYTSALHISKALLRGAQMHANTIQEFALRAEYAERGLHNMLQCYELRTPMPFQDYGWEVNVARSTKAVHLELFVRFILNLRDDGDYGRRQSFLDRVVAGLRALGVNHLLDVVKQTDLEFNRKAQAKLLTKVTSDKLSGDFRAFMLVDRKSQGSV